MKKLICFIFVLAVLLSSLTACNFTTNISGALESKAESPLYVEEMLVALAENRSADAKNLLHPHLTEKSDESISQMIDYMSGCEIISMEMNSINISTSTGTSGKSRQEQVTYKVTLTDGAVIYINTTYLSDNAGTGFTSFQLVLGVI